MPMYFNNFWNRFFGRDENEASKTMAKERLRLVLVHDRLDVSEQLMDSLRVDMIAVISKYFRIDEQALEVKLTRESEGMALVANMPINVPRRETAPGKQPQPAAPALSQGSLFNEVSPPQPDKAARPPQQGGGKKKQQNKQQQHKQQQNKQAAAKKPEAEHAVEAYIK